MHWIYILKCENGYYYVGETERLYRRFWEHFEGNGGINTNIFEPKYLVALYRTEKIQKFLEYNENIILNKNLTNYSCNMFKYFNEDIDIELNKKYYENYITEVFKYNNKEQHLKIRGGNYIRFDCNYKMPDNSNLKYIPVCYCGLPCDINKNEEDLFLYFRCSKKNIWKDLNNTIECKTDFCSFFKKYVLDINLKNNRSEILKNLFKKSYWLIYVESNNEKYPEQCVGGCYRTSKSIKLSYSGIKRNLCFDCFIEKNEELKNKYDIQFID